MNFAGALTLLFVAAKLWGKVEWSWWIVLSPFIVAVLLDAATSK